MVVQKIWVKTCSNEFFLKHALLYRRVARNEGLTFVWTKTR